MIQAQGDGKSNASLTYALTAAASYSAEEE